jgi:hypothetical protein
LFLFDGAGKSTHFMAEQLALDQVGRQGRTVDLDKGIFGTVTVVMNRIGDQLLSRAAFAADENRGVAFRHLEDHLENLPHLVAVADDVGNTVLVFQLLPEPTVLIPQLIFFALNGFQVDHVLGHHGGDHGKQFFTFGQVVTFIIEAIDAQGPHHLVAFLDRCAEK